MVSISFKILNFWLWIVLTKQIRLLQAKIKLINGLNVWISGSNISKSDAVEDNNTYKIWSYIFITLNGLNSKIIRHLDIW